MWLKEFSQFHHQQAVVNTYIDEELVNRNGFWFEEMEISGQKLIFKKDGATVHYIEPFEEQKLVKEPVFKNYFTISEDKTKIEIYFP